VPEVKLTAELRTEFGKGAARRIRRAHKVPAVLYGHDEHDCDPDDGQDRNSQDGRLPNGGEGSGCLRVDRDALPVRVDQTAR